MNSSSSTTRVEEPLTPSHLTLLIGAAFLRFINLGFTDLQAWDEALYAVRAQVVVQAGLWIDQTTLAIDGLYSSLHPPLYVWGTALAYQCFGISEFSARFVSALSGGITVFVIYFLGKELHSKRTGVWAALLFSFTPFTLFYSRQGQFDALLVLFLALAAFSILRGMKSPDLHHSALAGVFVGCALMTKLFVAFGIPVVYALWIFAARPEHKPEHWKRLGILLLVASLIAAPWHVYMTIVHGGGSLLFFLESSAIVQRTLFGIEGNVKPLEILYYPNQLLVLFPFGTCAFLYWAWRSSRMRDPHWVFMTLWFGFFFAAFSLMRTKLAVYLLPMLVPASLLAGRSFDEMNEGTMEEKALRFIVVGMVFSVIWSASQQWRSACKEILSAAASFHLPSSATLSTAGLFLLILAVGCGIPLILLRGRLLPLSRYVPSLALLTSFAISAATVVILDRVQYDDGAASLAGFVDRSEVKNVVVAGYERNPQLTYYLRGADIGWRDDLHVRRIIPPSDTSFYSSWIRTEMTGEPASTLLLIEKDKFIRYKVINPNSFLSDGYIRVFESRRYAAFIAGRADFLATDGTSMRNHHSDASVQKEALFFSH